MALGDAVSAPRRGMGALRAGVVALACALAPGAPLRAGARPLVAVLGTCGALAADAYPADTQNWFDASRSSQVLFYAHLLFPVEPSPDELLPDGPVEPWHPPMAVPVPGADAALQDGGHFAEAEWLDPQGARIAYFGRTLTARTRADWISVAGRDYIPHTFAMAIGTRDLRTDAGQAKLPSLEGQYTVRLRVDGRSVGLAFFRMLRATQAPANPSAAPLSPAAQRAAPTPIPPLPPVQLP
jgi:hypothetical protein